MILNLIDAWIHSNNSTLSYHGGNVHGWDRAGILDIEFTSLKDAMAFTEDCGLWDVVMIRDAITVPRTSVVVQFDMSNVDLSE